MTFTRKLLLLAAAIACFAIALLLDVSVLHGTHEQAWVDGGLGLFAASFLP